MVLAVAAGCSEDAPQPQRTESTAQAATGDAIEDVVDRGPVTMTVQARPATVTVGEKVQLTIDVVAEEGVSVLMPELGEELGAFAVRSRNTPPDVPEDGMRHWTHTYALDTFATGAVEIPSVELQFTDARQSTVDENGAPVDTAIATDPLMINVQGVLRGDEAETDYRDIRDPVDVSVPGEGFNWWVIALAAASAAIVGALAAIVIALISRRSKSKPTVPPEPAHVRALRALDELAAAGLIGQGAFHEFYTRLSSIVRQYIEQRFGLMAPERTTEEFLREAERDPQLSAAHRELLTGFLRAADMVKFARFKPRSEEAQAALDAARGFVRETATAVEPADGGTQPTEATP